MCWPRASNRVVLMGQSCSIYHREERRPQPGEVFISLRVPPRNRTPSQEAEEGWQLVEPRRMCPRSVKQLEDVLRLQVERHIHNLGKVRGICFNCLALGHQVASCRDPARCWFCHRSGHISTKCPSRKGNKPTNPSKSMFPSSNQHTCSIHHQLCSQPDQLVEMMLHPRMPEAVKDNKIDPMCEEAGLVLLPKIKKSIVRSFPVSSTIANEGQESFKVAQVVIVAPHQMLATSARMNIEQKAKIVGEEISVPTKEFFPNHSTRHEGSISMLDIVGTRTPLQIRSEVDQLIGHKLAKALSSFKHDVIAPLSPSILCNTSSEKEAVVVSKKGNQRCNQKLLSQRPNIKVVQDLLTKKWIIIKANKQLGVSNLKHTRTLMQSF
jgi:hypothetical protein